MASCTVMFSDPGLLVFYVVNVCAGYPEWFCGEHFIGVKALILLVGTSVQCAESIFWYIFCVFRAVRSKSPWL
jgi:hypothetical protein